MGLNEELARLEQQVTRTVAQVTEMEEQLALRDVRLKALTAECHELGKLLADMTAERDELKRLLFGHKE